MPQVSACLIFAVCTVQTTLQQYKTTGRAPYALALSQIVAVATKLAKDLDCGSGSTAAADASP